MLNILFWNVQRKDLRHGACAAARDVNADVVVLLENGVAKDETLAELRTKASPDFAIPVHTSERFQLFSREESLDLAEDFDGGRDK